MTFDKRSYVPTSKMCVRCGAEVKELPPIVLCPKCQALDNERYGPLT